MHAHSRQPCAFSLAPQVYSVALYVDEAGARADLQRAQQAGELGSDDAVASALVSGPYTKVLQVGGRLRDGIAVCARVVRVKQGYVMGVI